MSSLITRASISFGRTRQGRRPGSGLGRPLAGGGVGKRLDGRREQHVGGNHRVGDRRRRLAGMRVPFGHHRQHGLGSDRLGFGPHRLAEFQGRRVADDQHFFVRPHSEAVADDGSDGFVEFF